MGRRTNTELDIYVGTVRSFEWFWASNDEMPGRDAFDALDEHDQDAVMATFKYWGDLELGKHASKTRINEECDDPKVLAAKAGKHRFGMFHAGDNIWIVSRYYVKQKQKLDRAGRVAIKLTTDDLNEYAERVKIGDYYERS